MLRPTNLQGFITLVALWVLNPYDRGSLFKTVNDSPDDRAGAPSGRVLQSQNHDWLFNNLISRLIA